MNKTIKSFFTISAFTLAFQGNIAISHPVLTAKNNATIFSKMDGDRIEGLVLSRFDPNRISFEDDRIHSFNGSVEDYDFQPNKKTGDLFIRQKGNNEFVKQPSFFVTTEAGFTYHFFVMFANIPARQIHIRNEDAAHKKYLKTIKQDREEYLDKDKLKENINYIYSMFADGKLFPLKDPKKKYFPFQIKQENLSFIPHRTYKIDYEDIIMNEYYVQNHSNKPVSIDPESFRIDGIHSVKISKEAALNMGEINKVFIFRRDRKDLTKVGM